MPLNKEITIYNAVDYLRLSKEDGDKAESDSIAMTALGRMGVSADAVRNAVAELARKDKPSENQNTEAAKRIGLGTHLGRPWASVLTDVLRALDATPETGGES
mgnify:CR=1 FL=1